MKHFYNNNEIRNRHRTLAQGLRSSCYDRLKNKINIIVAGNRCNKLNMILIKKRYLRTKIYPQRHFNLQVEYFLCFL